ncbi:hypothetical protein CEE45_15290 [Candidatus Heimdallarchaeota archaeon B3_Heim]|nr:MAG: hypothetical protein CEE45_15290 [Candidatus Heimdallarchaeota archaeon B3_Heim]
MKVIYRYYESDQGLEELQAQIYNDEHERSPKSAFGKATADQIKQRYINEKKDRLGVRYALDEEGNPLAYIQTTFSESPPQTWIGYPWAMEHCPVEVQTFLYDEMLDYVMKKFPDNEIVMGYFTETWKRQTEFAENKGFVLKDKAFFYSVDTKKVKKASNHEFLVRNGTMDDATILIDLCKTDPNISDAFPNDEEWKSYFGDRVIPDNHVIMLFRDNLLAAAGAPLRGYYDHGILVRFTAIRPGFEDAWKILLQEIAFHCNAQQWNEPLLFNSFTNKELANKVAEDLGAFRRDTQVLYVLQPE